MRLTDEQSKYLRILGHELHPILDVGAGGLTNSVLREIDKALDDHELVKVRVPYGDRQRRYQVIEDLVPLAHAHLVQRAGNVVLLYRASTQQPVIKLPGAAVNH